MRISEYANIRICERANIRICEYPNMRMCEYPNMRICESAANFTHMSYSTHVTHFSGTYYQLPLVMCGRINTLYIIVNVTARSENYHSNVSVD